MGILKRSTSVFVHGCVGKHDNWKENVYPVEGRRSFFLKGHLEKNQILGKRKQYST